MPLAVGGDLLDRGQVRVLGRDAAQGVRRAETDVGLRPGLALAPHVRGLRRDGLTLTLAFPAEATQDVQAFVVEESKCCPFFSFRIDEINQGVRLGIRTPPGGEAMLDALQAALAGNAANLPDRPNDQGA